MTRGRGQSGQAIVEFAVVAPALVLLIFGLIAGGWLFFQYEAVGNAAAAAARAAVVETDLLSPGGCESGLPAPIEQSAQAAATIVRVDQASLCESTTNPEELVQATQPAGEAVITVTGTPGLSPDALQQVTATVSLAVSPLPMWPSWTVTLQAGSTLSVP